MIWYNYFIYTMLFWLTFIVTLWETQSHIHCHSVRDPVTHSLHSTQSHILLSSLRDPVPFQRGLPLLHGVTPGNFHRLSVSTNCSARYKLQNSSSVQRQKFNYHWRCFQIPVLLPQSQLVGVEGHRHPATKNLLQYPWVDNWLMANSPLVVD